MTISISDVDFQEDEKQIRVTVDYSKQVGDNTQTAQVCIFIDWVDSYAAIKQQAIAKANTFLALAASAH